MINAIITGISRELCKEFGKGYKVHKESIKQGLEEPCFFVDCVNSIKKLFRGNKYFQQNLFCINYFPENEKKRNEECNETAERLIWCLEYITVNGNQMRGTQMHYEIVDGVLNFFVNYDCFIYKVEQQTSMENLETSTNVKGDG